MMPRTKLPAFIPYHPEDRLKAAEKYLLWLELVPPNEALREVGLAKFHLGALQQRWAYLEENRTRSDEWDDECAALADEVDRLIESMKELWLRGIA
jgi:hypothetical protein